jgi:pullulanase
MPLTAWTSDDFSWGYNPALFFSVEHRYTNSPATPLDKLFKLQTLINKLHASGIHVIIDGVFNHAEAKDAPGGGFPYYWLYENPTESPFVGNFAGTGYFEDLDYSNNCTEEFIRDVCMYWLDVFQFDGIRFDYVLGFYRKANVPVGISELITDLKHNMADSGRRNVSFTLEMLTDNRFEAIGKTNEIGAGGCWFDPFLWEGFGIVESGNIQTSLVRRLNSGYDFDTDKVPVTYGENHDHSTLTEHAGGRDNRWWRTQPLAIALFTCCGAPMVHNGQEFGEQYWLPEEGGGRVAPRPLRWTKSNDPIGNSLRQLYARLAQIRKAHPALRSSNFYPEPYDEQQEHFNLQGYGVNVDQDVAIYHRWASDEAGRLERFIIVLNCSDFSQRVDIPFSDNGDWEDILNGGTVRVESYWLKGEALSSNWGRIYFKLS